MSKSLKEIVESKDLIALEKFCIKCGTYAQVRIEAEKLGIDLDELEELLARI